jgi:Raf kinase inhibitor-like YbhB/YbcL family protein
VTYSSQPPIMPTPLQQAGITILQHALPRDASNRMIFTGFRRTRECLERVRRLCRSALFSAGLLATLCSHGPMAQAAPKEFTLASPTVRTGGTMPAMDVGARGDCRGSDQSPPLIWLRPPDGTASYAVSMADLDAKVGVVWLWLMFNIPASVSVLPQNAAADAKLRPPGAMQAKNGFDTVGYFGPCPRKGSIAHHYLITVWAVNQANLPFKDGAASQTVAIYLRRHSLGHASLTPHYGGR